ncbi:MAG TPA: N-6 DNA methylase [Solirubrobacterales bacterium]|nr:N-6 DNA methylase [Solirubrobacterales bacterium]
MASAQFPIPSSGVEQLSANGAPSLEDRLREIHNFIYANEGIKQYARVTDEVVKVIFARHTIEEKEAIDPRLDDARIAETARAAFQAAAAAAVEIEPFEPGESLKLSDSAIAFAMRKLCADGLRHQDPNGVAFQTILGPTLRGELGQFFTPDPIKKLLVAMTRPAPGDVCCDPASGTAGLLLEVRKCQPLAKIVGAEVDAALARLARLNLLFAGEERPEIHRLDALRPLGDVSHLSGGSLRGESCNVIVSNPPFGSKGKVSNPEILAEMPHVIASKKAVPPELLFIERIVQLLRAGGRAGIVLPIGILSNPSTSHVREYLRSTGRIYATVSLPAETFRPTGNSVQASIIFFEKTSKQPTGQYPVFRAISRSVGYDHRGRVVNSSDTPQILGEWDKFRGIYRGEYPWAI